MSFYTVENQFRDLFAENVSRGNYAPLTQNSRAGVTQFSKSAGATVVESRDSSTGSSQLVPQNQYQKLLRPIFGKIGVNPPSIGDHPDFEHLRGTDREEFCSVTTLFMDMEGSTRLNLLHSPSEVARIKNAFIQMAIEVVKAFDGHVHRIMGDAVMAFFGGRGTRSEVASIDAINCASVLQLLVRRVVVPFLEKEGFGNEFGIRIGLDYGPADRVLWRSYGFPEMEEVTATSFFVDVASKLQHAAGRNQIMIGSSLRGLLDFPEELLAVKTAVRNGEEVKLPFLLPNLTNRDGQSIDYRQHVLRWDSYLIFSPLADGLSEEGIAGLPKVSATIHSERHGQEEGPFVSGCSLGGKGKALRFRIGKLPFMPQLPYVVKCIVENHGDEARNAAQDLGNHESVYTIEKQDDHREILHWEDLAYRGLHYLTVEVRKKCGALIARRKFGVYVE